MDLWILRYLEFRSNSRFPRRIFESSQIILNALSIGHIVNLSHYPLVDTFFIVCNFPDIVGGPNDHSLNISPKLFAQQ